MPAQDKVVPSTDTKLISKCGIYCGACYVYRAFKDGGKMLDETAMKLSVPREKVKCKGCLGPAEDLWRNCLTCHISTCLKEKGLGFCYECPAFEDTSCLKYERLRQGTLRRGENTKEALLRIKAGDAEGWLKEQDRKWRCPGCGNPVWWEQKVCYGCGQSISTR